MLLSVNINSKANMLSTRKIKGLIFFFFFIEWFSLYFGGSSRLFGKILSISLLTINIYYVILSYKYRQLWLMAMFLFMLSYNYEPIKFFFYNQDIGGNIASYQNNANVYTVALCNFLFHIVLGLSISFRFTKKLSEPFILKAPVFIWCFCIIVGLVCILFGKYGESIFAAGGYAQSLQSRESSSLYGYGVIPIAVSLIYSTSRFRRFVVYLLISIYIIKDFAFGGRIDSLILILIIYLIHFRFIMSSKLTVISLLVIYATNTVWEIFRSSVYQNIYDILEATPETVGISTSNSGAVYYASMRIIFFIENGILSFSDRIASFIYFLLSCFVPYNYLPPIANLSAYLKDSYYTGGGGLCSVFIFAMGGFIGIIILAKFIGFLLTRLMSYSHITSKNKYFFFYIILCIATFPRWYAYYPIALIKFCMVGALFFLITEQLKKIKLK